MRYLLSTIGALLLGDTVRYVAGSAAGICTMASVISCSIFFDKQPLMFLLLACGVWAGVRFRSKHALQVLNLVPLCTLAVLLLMGKSTASTDGLFLADLIALISLAYRGWANKRLLD